jgi:hypothetical protein
VGFTRDWSGAVCSRGGGRLRHGGQTGCAAHCLLSAPGGQRQGIRFVAIVDGGLQLDDDSVGGGGLVAGRQAHRCRLVPCVTAHKVSKSRDSLLLEASIARLRELHEKSNRPCS